MMPKLKTDAYYIGVLGKTADILDVFIRVKKPMLALQEISKAANLNKNTVFRVLYTLAEHGYVVKQGRDYRLGSKLLELGQAMLGSNKDLLAVAGPYLDALRDRFSETVNLGVLDGGQIRYVDVRESPQRFRLAERVGGSDHLHCTALGKAWMAHLPFEEVRRLLKRGMPQQTDHTVVTVTGMKVELERVRKLGYAVDAEESMEGAYCVGVPVLGGGVPVAALSISGPTIRFGPGNLPDVSQALLAAAAGIRQRMGYL